MSNDDFKFVMTTDMNDEKMEEFGRLPICYSFFLFFNFLFLLVIVNHLTFFLIFV